MANIKVSNLTEDTTPATDDFVMTVDTSATASKKVKLVNLFQQFLPAGAVCQYAGASAPTNWLFCDGSAVSRTTYANLFTAIGTTWGSGDGSTTFNIPDARQKFALGKASSGTGATLASTGGTIDHVHVLSGTNAAASIVMSASSGAGTLQMRRVSTSTWAETHDNVTSLSFNGSTNSASSGAALQGSSQSANPPFFAINYIIKT